MDSAAKAAQENRKDLDKQRVQQSPEKGSVSPASVQEGQMPGNGANTAASPVATSQKGGIGMETAGDEESKTGLTPEQKAAYDKYVQNALQGAGINEKPIHRLNELDAGIVAELEKRGFISSVPPTMR